MIRAWMMMPRWICARMFFVAGLCWQAHKDPLACLCLKKAISANKFVSTLSQIAVKATSAIFRRFATPEGTMARLVGRSKIG